MPKAKPQEPNLTYEEVKMQSLLYNSFAAIFGERDANRVIDSGHHLRERVRKSDYFLDCLAVAIGYECFTTEEYRLDHGYEHSTNEYLLWIKEHANFDEYKEEKDSSVLGYKKKFQALGLF